MSGGNGSGGRASGSGLFIVLAGVFIIVVI